MESKKWNCVPSHRGKTTDPGSEPESHSDRWCWGWDGVGSRGVHVTYCSVWGEVLCYIVWREVLHYVSRLELTYRIFGGDCSPMPQVALGQKKEGEETSEWNEVVMEKTAQIKSVICAGDVCCRNLEPLLHSKVVCLSDCLSVCLAVCQSVYLSVSHIVS